MSQSLAGVYIHLIFSTKKREKNIPEQIRRELQAYITGVSSNLKSYVHEIYANPDHIHMLFELPRTITISKYVQKIKTSSSSWMKKQGVKNFEWQNGYGAFSVSQSKLEIVKAYIQNQDIHHQKMSFQDEFRLFLKEYQIDYDERYVWD
ncbi:MAG: IS200/IS605 family transposase [Mongoliibacter sp.]|uniref:IS200/IS605 family transposase n=1 Tax=Mongoliibacter sp. TaxID=2022438 RepID=UPI0012EEF27C|nr:IS200/IS605 family transposase [Mongoliibacter sp.]TVP51663.1 MAG: IS200/IS605 family transposase [Mongoliibacter sp.]